MMKILIGIILGIVLITYYPEIGSVVSEIFIETGMRDDLVNTLEGM
jgi:Na+/H+-dicarboxylate symporter